MADNRSRAVTEVNEYYNELGKSTEESGKKVGQSFENLSVKVDLDCSDALTGLKALQREARKTTQAIAELESEAERFTTKYTDEKGVPFYAEWSQYGDKVSDAKHVKIADVLAKVPTAELTEELAKREGVVNLPVDSVHSAEITIRRKDGLVVYTDDHNGPTRILVVTD